MLQYITVKENINILYSPIAQLVEQMTVNHLVVSSSLTRGAIFISRPLSGLFLIYKFLFTKSFLKIMLKNKNKQ